MEKAIPDGYHTVTPHLAVSGVAAAIDFYARALGAEELVRMPFPNSDLLMHAEVKIGDSIVMLADERNPSLSSFEVSPFSLMLYCEDVDALFARAVEAGAEVIESLSDTFWGDRTGRVRDPFGHVWVLAQHVRDVPPDEMVQAMREAFAD